MNSKINNHISYVEIETSLFNLNILDYQQTYKTPKSYNVYKPISEFPSSSRDLSFSIKDVDACKLLEDTVLSFSHEFIKDIFIFDYYKNEKMEEIKIAFRFIFQSNKGTLKEKEVNDVINTIIKQALSIKTVQIPGLKN
jgi:phenylalanyl-tRNA synthetase beta chain